MYINRKYNFKNQTTLFKMKDEFFISSLISWSKNSITVNIRDSVKPKVEYSNFWFLFYLKAEKQVSKPLTA